MKKLIALFWSFFNQAEAQLQKLVRHLPDWITPNGLTMLRAVLTIPIILAIQNNHYLFAIFLFLGAYFLDLLDGPLARVKNQVTEFGKIFDPTADKIVFLSVFFLVGKDYLPFPLMLLIFSLEIFLLLLVIILRPLAFLILKLNIPLGANIFGKIKMFFQALGIMTLLLFIKFHQNVSPATIILAIATIFSSLSILGHLLAVQRKSFMD